MLARKGCVPHGKNEVLVNFEVDGEGRNHLLRDVTALVQRYTDHEATAKTERAALEESIAARRAIIDAAAFEQAEEEILNATAKASPDEEI
jgi:hypothetical protein